MIAADDLNIEVGNGELVGIVGANGSGKTTFLNLITGYLKPESGRILVMGQDTTDLAPRDLAKRGVARSFQIPQLYTNMSVLEGVLLSLAATSGESSNFWRPLHRDPWEPEAWEILNRFGLEPYASRPVSELPEGGRKLLDIALSFALKPTLLVMDEPTSGVSIEDKFQVMDTLVGVLREGDITTIFVEHDMDVVQRYGRRVLVFDTGRVVADGEPESVLAQPEVRRAVLGHE
ncbi:MAG: ATP-binding cassette domain-containing protein [Defluviicoccus sp.]|nr:ATP-binding cassette domain-containing protein [Defluviicoccus sp.]MDE0386282.1 ATP-binding cassette domain-containing protein [Defluviicoccus sp.]